MDRRILVAYDGRDGGADALALGAQLAETLSAPLLLGSVFPAVRYHATIVAAGEFERQLRAGAEAQLATAVEGLGATGDVATRAVGAGSAPAGLHQLSVDEDAGLVVLGSTTHGKVGRILIGSTAQRLLHGSPCPVTVAPNGYRERSAEGFRTVGVGYDASPESEAALDAAAKLAQAAGASVRVVSLVEPQPPIGGGPISSWPASLDAEGDELMRDLVEDRRAALRSALARLPKGLDLEGYVEIGSPVADLTESGPQVDLLVVGSRGYGPMRSVLLGAVSAQVMRSAKVPVIVVPRGSESPL
jgi:nucleotide-binding universal stress UspA family protein